MGKLVEKCYSTMCGVLGRKPDFFYDNDKRKWGQVFAGIRCLSYNELIALPKNSKIIFSTRSAEKIHSQFLDRRFDSVHAFIFERNEASIKGIYDITRIGLERENLPTACKDVKNSWCYISGASRGIGAFIADQCANLGINLVIQARNKDLLEQKHSELSKKGVEVLACVAEFSTPRGLDQHCQWISTECPKLDFAFLNAGISQQPEEGGFFEGSTDGWITTQQVNVIAPWRITRNLIVSKLINKSGKVFFVSSSISGRLQESAYSCSKAALSKLVYDLSENANKLRLDFCLIDPGWVDTDMGGKFASNKVETLFPGVIFPILSTHSCNGSWISAQDYTGFTTKEAIKRALHLGDLKEA